MLVSLTVNNKVYSADVEPRLLLIDFIRDVLNLTGTKVGCDTGQCGTCVIQLNGRSVKSCSLLTVQSNGATVETIEGVARNGQMHALQEALWAQHGLQCGFCTPGVIMSILDLLQHNAAPDEKEIRSWLEGNLCRCTGYQSIVRAVLDTIEKEHQPTEVEELAPLVVAPIQ
jgi:carbon-monoxide dehydrogenase small subunit